MEKEKHRKKTKGGIEMKIELKEREERRKKCDNKRNER